jgi:hypothetical protein
MYSRTSKSAHYLPRTGSYSTVPHRNGRVDVLPPGATEALYGVAGQIEDGRKRLESLRAEKAALKDELADLRPKDALRLKWVTSDREARPSPRIGEIDARVSEIEAEAKRLRTHVAGLTQLLSSGQRVTIEDAFYRIAKAELPEDVWRRIQVIAESIVSRARSPKP